MQNDIFETLNKVTTQTLENFKKLGEAHLKIGEKLLQEQVELTAAFVETTKETAQELSETRDAGKITAIQTEWAQNWSKQLVESSRTYADILAEAGKVYNQMFETTLKNVGGDIAKAGKGKKAA
jgi:phasin family protein